MQNFLVHLQNLGFLLFLRVFSPIIAHHVDIANHLQERSLPAFRRPRIIRFVMQDADSFNILTSFIAIAISVAVISAIYNDVPSYLVMHKI